MYFKWTTRENNQTADGILPERSTVIFVNSKETLQHENEDANWRLAF